MKEPKYINSVNGFWHCKRKLIVQISWFSKELKCSHNANENGGKIVRKGNNERENFHKRGKALQTVMLELNTKFCLSIKRSGNLTM